MSEEIGIEAAARWLMADDSAYAAEPEHARRAARHMIAAWKRAIIETRSGEREPRPGHDA